MEQGNFNVIWLVSNYDNFDRWIRSNRRLDSLEKLENQQKGGVHYNFFWFLKTGTLLPIMYESKPKNRQIWPCAHGKVFTFKKWLKIPRTLKINIFWQFANTFLLCTSKNNHKQKSKFNFLWILFWPQMGKFVFNLVKGNTKFSFRLNL